MASIPARTGTLAQAVDSIIDQVDQLHVYLNGYDEVPQFLDSPKVVVYRSQEHGDQADNGKFFGLHSNHVGTYFTLDDDIIYPPDYVPRMVAALGQIHFEGVVGVHGVCYPAVPSSFLQRRIIKYTEKNRWLRPVSLLGTGTVAFSIPFLGLDAAIFRTAGMADVWLAKHMKDRGIPMFAVARPEQWLTDADLPRDSPTIWTSTKRDHTLPSRVIAEGRPWGLDDLFERSDGMLRAGRLPKKWSDFRAFCEKLRAQGAPQAVASLSTAAKIWDYVAFYCDPAETFAVADAALTVQGQQSLLFRRAATASAKCDALEAALLLERGLQDAVFEGQREDTVWLACRASRFFRYAGEFERAGRALDLAIDSQEHSPEVQSERVNLATDLHDHTGAQEFLVAASSQFPRNADYYHRLAHATAWADSLAAAAPWITKLFMEPDAKSQQRMLTSALRVLRSRGEVLSGLPSFQSLESACVDGTVDPLPTLHLYLSLGDREGAGRLLEKVRQQILRQQENYLPWVEAAVAPSLDTAISHVNRALASAGFAELSLKDGKATPLARLWSALPASAEEARVSVIMTAYNASETISYAIESIIHQTVTPLELIVVDDASDDGTGGIISGFAASDSRVIHLTAERNLGPYGCRNLALSKARGDYIAIQDCDDYSHPQRLAHQLRLLSGGDAVACFTGHVRINDDGALVPDNHGELLGEGPMTLMMRRQVYEELGYFLPVRSRGDVEHRERMMAFYGSHRVLMDRAVLLFALDSVGSNSRVFDEDLERVQQVRRQRMAGRRRHQLAAGGRAALYVADSAVADEIVARGAGSGRG